MLCNYIYTASVWHKWALYHFILTFRVVIQHMNCRNFKKTDAKIDFKNIKHNSNQGFFRSRWFDPMNP